jgi:hypothetical protein
MDFSTQDFSTMNSSTQDSYGVEKFMDEWSWVEKTRVEISRLIGKMNSLYQISSKMLHSTKLIILVEKKKRGGLAGLLEVESANHYTMDPS